MEAPNKLLIRQLTELYGANPPTEIQALVGHVNKTYNELQRTNELRTKQLIGSTAQAYSFLDSLGKGFLMCDLNGEIVLTNNAVRQMLDGSESTVWSMQRVAALLAPAIDLPALVNQCLNTGTPIEYNEVPRGIKVLRVYMAPITSDAGPLGIAVLIEDITEDKVLERSKDEFLSIASHELRTPLTAIRGNTSLISKYYKEELTNPDLAEMISDIHESSERLIGIVNDFLDAAAIEQGRMKMEPTQFALSELIPEVIHELAQLCEAKGIQLIADASTTEIPTVTADRQRIKQVLINLIGNATKFTDEGSITLSAKADDKLVHITVTDTGRGMSLENQKLLFRKFQQAGSSILTRDTTRGTGLGLYISKLIVELSGGTIKLDRSEPDVGSSFTFSLPL